jgi:hypothetical protein
MVFKPWKEIFTHVSGFIIVCECEGLHKLFVMLLVQSIDYSGSYSIDLHEQYCILIYVAKGRCEESKSLINPNDIQNAPMMIITKNH